MKQKELPVSHRSGIRPFSTVLRKKMIPNKKYNTPKVSVIIPTYNRGDLIGRAIQSILDQTFQAFEIIIVDDGSIDSTDAIVKTFSDPRITYIYQENQGICAARNTGISSASGIYISFLDSDDALIEYALEKGVEILEQHPEVGLHYGLARCVSETGDFLCNHKSFLPAGIWSGLSQLQSLLTIGNYIPPSATMVRKKAVTDAGMFDSSFSSGSEDYDLWVRLCRHWSVSHIKVPVTNYLVHTDSISGKRSVFENTRSHRRILGREFHDPAISRDLKRIKSRAYFSLHLRFASYIHAAGDTPRARTYLLKGLSIYPQIFKKVSFFLWLGLLIKTYIPKKLLFILRST